MAPDTFSRVAEKLRVKRQEVEEMHERLSGRDVRLDAPVGDDGDATRLDHLPFPAPTPDHQLASAQARTLLTRRVSEALAQLGPRERLIVEERVMSDHPVTLTELGERLGISRERARQLELRAKAKLRRRLEAVAVEVGLASTAPDPPARSDDRPDEASAA